MHSRFDSTIPKPEAPSQIPMPLFGADLRFDSELYPVAPEDQLRQGRRKGLNFFSCLQSGEASSASSSKFHSRRSDVFIDTITADDLLRMSKR